MSVYVEVNGELKEVAKSFNFKPKLVSYSDSPYSLESDFNMIFADATSGSIQINLPDPGDSSNRMVVFTKTNSGNTVTIKYETTTIKTLSSENETVNVISDGSSWVDYDAAVTVAADIPIVDANGRISATDVENALQEITGSGRTTETIKGNAANIITLSNTISTISSEVVKKTGNHVMAGDLEVSGELKGSGGLSVGGGTKINKITISSEAPSGGSDGDIWLRYES